MRARLVTLAAAAIAIATAGCGDDKVAPSGASTTPTQPVGPGIEESNRPADPGSVRVIRGWTDAQRASRIDRATSYFAVPAIVQNGAEAQRLATRPEVRSFNAALPCGAVLVRTSAATQRGFTVATFRLVNRPGKQCDGTGAQARTAFEVRGGRIRTWLRIADRAPSSPQPPATPTGDGIQSA